MSNLLNQLQEAIDSAIMRTYKHPTKIKVTSDFAKYLEAECTYKEIYDQDDSLRGYKSYLTGIPVVIDDTIEDPLYEIVYEEEKKMNLKKIKQMPTLFPSHKVTIKAIKKWNGNVYIWQPPCNAINYLYEQEKVTITIVKQREISIKILVECSDSIYERIKLDFIRMMGDKFIWKD